MTNDTPKRKSVRFIGMDQELMLHNPITRKFHILNPTASMIWSLCDGSHTLEQISMKLKKKFKESGEDILQDVCKTVEELRKDGFLE